MTHGRILAAVAALMLFSCVDGRRRHGLDRDARANFLRRCLDPRRQHACIRYGMEHLQPGDRICRRCRAWPDPDQSPCRNARPGHCRGRISKQRGGATDAGLSRSGARLRLLPLRPRGTPLHRARRVAAGSGWCRYRQGDSRHRQRCRRAALDPGRHDRSPRSQGAGLRSRQVQRFQYLLPSGGIRHVGRLFGLAGRQYRRRSRRTQCRCQQLRCQQLLPAAGPHRTGIARVAEGNDRPARHAADDVSQRALRRTSSTRADRRVGTHRAQRCAATDRHADGRAGHSRVCGSGGSGARRHPASRQR